MLLPLIVFPKCVLQAGTEQIHHQKCACPAHVERQVFVVHCSVRYATQVNILLKKVLPTALHATQMDQEESTVLNADSLLACRVNVDV
jgi:hypothetical protein|tara:strand:- start:289 stop:552 length:264 start_codon:yes stop_codon:yes gene_type:complete